MRDNIITYLPWLLSAITIWMTVLAGNKHPSAWLFGLATSTAWRSAYWPNSKRERYHPFALFSPG